MSGYLLAFVVFAVAYIALRVYINYARNRRARRYQILDTIEEIIASFVVLIFANWMLFFFFNGHDSGIGWWFLSGLAGLVVLSCITVAVNSICRTIWPIDVTSVVETVKISKKAKFAGDVFAFVGCLGITALFIYCLISSDAFDGTVEMILGILCAVFFAFGSLFNFKMLFIKRR